jgi:serine/threonine protein phosphatase PrpC
MGSGVSKYCKSHLLGRILDCIRQEQELGDGEAAQRKGKITRKSPEPESAGQILPKACPSFPTVRRALIRAFEDTDCAVLDAGLIDGSTAVVLAVTSTHLIVGNVGDCRAVLAVRDSEEGKFRAVDLSDDHDPRRREDEQKRIAALGGTVKDGWVEDMLSMTRAMGDVVFKRYLIATPEVRAVTRKAEHAFVVVASDGVWRKLGSKEVVAAIASTWDQEDHGAAALRKRAQCYRSSDNICIIIVDVSDGAKGIPTRVSVPSADGGHCGTDEPEGGPEVDGPWSKGEVAKFREWIE